MRSDLLGQVSLSVSERENIVVGTVALHEVDTDAAIGTLGVDSLVVDMDGVRLIKDLIVEHHVGLLSEQDRADDGHVLAQARGILAAFKKLHHRGISVLSSDACIAVGLVVDRGVAGLNKSGGRGLFGLFWLNGLGVVFEDDTIGQVIVDEVWLLLAGNFGSEEVSVAGICSAGTIIRIGPIHILAFRNTL